MPAATCCGCDVTPIVQKAAELDLEVDAAAALHEAAAAAVDEADGLVRSPKSPMSPTLKLWEADLGAEGAAQAAEQRRLSASAAADAQLLEMEARAAA